MKRPHPEMTHGDEAADRFTRALKAVLSIPKASIPAPFSKPKVKKTKRPATKHKG